MRSIILATRNRHKLREIRQVLGELPVDVLSLDAAPPVPEPEETGLTFAENARIKATYYARQTGMWCLADDSGISVDALDGRPGVRSARYAADRCPDGADKDQIAVANNGKLLEELAEVPAAKRTAHFTCHLAMSDGTDILLEAAGTLTGQIALAPSGDKGFGYDPIFIADAAGRPVAELSAEQKNAISHRGQAVRQFADKLAKLLDRCTP